MIASRRFKVLICFIAAIALSCTKVGAEVLDKIVAVVNDDIILHSELRKEVQRFMRTRGKEVPLPESVIERQVLERMIQEKLVDQEMKRLKISVSDSAVESAIEKIKQDNGWTDEQFQYILQQRNMTYDEFKEEMRKELERNLLIERVFQSKTVITDEQIDEYLNESQNNEPTVRVNLSVIFIPKDQATDKSPEEILEEIRKGADFYEMARKYSRGPAASEGGKLGWIELGELAKPLQKVLVTMKPGQVSPVVPLEAGYFIVKLESIERQKIGAEISPAEREKIRRFLFKREVNRKFREWLNGLMKRSYIRVSL